MREKLTNGKKSMKEFLPWKRSLESKSAEDGAPTDGRWKDSASDDADRRKDSVSDDGDDADRREDSPLDYADQ